VDKDLWLMARLAQGRPLLLAEVGYSTAAQSNSSPALQNEFFQNFFTALSRRGNQFQMVTLWSLNDMPAQSLAQALANNGATSPAAAAFMGSLGLRDSSGNPKPAWYTYGVWQSGMNKTNACAATN
jgi:hypothetical protein